MGRPGNRPEGRRDFVDPSYARRGGDGRRAPARVHLAIDPIGAGDAFAAGFLAANLQGLDDQRALEAGAAVAAYAVASLGDIEGLPTERELDLVTKRVDTDTLR